MTNYYNTFIEVAPDCPVSVAEPPPIKKPMTAARIGYDMVYGHPYEYTSDDVLYMSYGARCGISREEFFAKGQPCFRKSALTQRYGWGLHCDAEGRIAIYAVETAQYARFASDPAIKHIKAMRSRKARP